MSRMSAKSWTLRNTGGTGLPGNIGAIVVCAVLTARSVVITLFIDCWDILADVCIQCQITHWYLCYSPPSSGEMPRPYGGLWSTVDESRRFSLLPLKVCNFLSQRREPRVVKCSSNLGNVLADATKLFVKL